MSRLDNAIAAALAPQPPAPPVRVETIRYRGVAILAHYRGARPISYGPERYRSRRAAALAVLLAREKVRVVAGMSIIRYAQQYCAGPRVGWRLYPVWRLAGLNEAMGFATAAGTARQAAAITSHRMWAERAALGLLPLRYEAKRLLADQICVARLRIHRLRQQRAEAAAAAAAAIRERLIPRGGVLLRQKWARAKDGTLRYWWIGRSGASVSLERAIAEGGEIRAAALAEPDPAAPETLGWRAWSWDGAVLRSPHQDTPWPDGELRAEWDSSKAVRGVCGIHARRLPLDWRRAPWLRRGDQEGPGSGPNLVTGIVEIMPTSRYLLGRTGWRAEWVRIAALRAPTEDIAAALRRLYPEVEIIVSPAAAGGAADTGRRSA